jgi:dephospho-CoA kinase
MIVAALTGSVAMGKTETARLFAARGIPVFDSDAAVHALYSRGGEAVPEIERLVPSAVQDGSVDRQRLAAEVVAHPDLLEAIENIVHPMVRARQQRFLEEARRAGSDIVVLDIPLLFETGGEKSVDKIIVVSAGDELQRQRAMKRSGMTVQKFEYLMSKQIPDAEKRARADYVIDTSVSIEDAKRQVDQVIAELKRAARRES